MDQVASPDAGPCDLVLVTGADPPRRGPDLPAPQLLLAHAVQHDVIRQDDVGEEPDLELRVVLQVAALLEPADLGQQDLRVKAFSAAPRSFSQPDASFIGSWRQGIHRKPLLT